jgi:Na+-translocating ferredoxin:NAD+ oxidoreductase RnfA subunit
MSDEVKEAISTVVKQTVDAVQAKYDAACDPWVYRMVTIFLGIITLSCIAAAFYLTTEEKEFPQFLTAVGSASGGALVAMLTNPPKQ